IDRVTHHIAHHHADEYRDGVKDVQTGEPASDNGDNRPLDDREGGEDPEPMRGDQIDDKAGVFGHWAALPSAGADISLPRQVMPRRRKVARYSAVISASRRTEATTSIIPDGQPAIRHSSHSAANHTTRNPKSAK